MCLQCPHSDWLQPRRPICGLSQGSCLHAAVLRSMSDIPCCCCAAFVGLEYDNPDRPEAANLLAIYSLVTGKSTVSIPYLLGSFMAHLLRIRSFQVTPECIINYLHPLYELR